MPARLTTNRATLDPTGVTLAELSSIEGSQRDPARPRDLSDRSPTSVDQATGPLRVFRRWCLRRGRSAWPPGQQASGLAGARRPGAGQLGRSASVRGRPPSDPVRAQTRGRRSVLRLPRRTDERIASLRERSITDIQLRRGAAVADPPRPVLVATRDRAAVRAIAEPAVDRSIPASRRETTLDAGCWTASSRVVDPGRRSGSASPRCKAAPYGRFDVAPRGQQVVAPRSARPGAQSEQRVDAAPGS